jgi:hypothetical protein
MKPVSLLGALFLGTQCLAFPAEQFVLSSSANRLGGSISHTAELFLDDAKKAILQGKEEMEKWIYNGKEFIKANGLLCEYLFWYFSFLASLLDSHLFDR